MVSEDDRNPLHHTQKMKTRLDEMISHLREDVENIDEPQFKAMFETAAEVLEGLKTAFAHYEQRSEKPGDKTACAPRGRCPPCSQPIPITQRDKELSALQRFAFHG